MILYTQRQLATGKEFGRNDGVSAPSIPLSLLWKSIRQSVIGSTSVRNFNEAIKQVKLSLQNERLEFSCQEHKVEYRACGKKAQRQDCQHQQRPLRYRLLLFVQISISTLHHNNSRRSHAPKQHYWITSSKVDGA